MIARCVVGAMALLCANALAHEVRPAYLRVTATVEGQYDVLWKQPVTAGRLLPLAPIFPDACAMTPAGVDAVANDALIRHLKLDCPDGLRGETIAVGGLAGTITDVMLHVQLADGTRISGLLTPTRAAMTIDAAAAVYTFAYLMLGVEHLLFGFDHILFVLCLLFFLHGRPAALVKAVTAFTAAHSITLGVSALNLVKLPQAPVEAVIALSILFLAVEKLRQPEHSLTVDHTWLVAFAFGLLHGFGFAGALADIGLPQDNLLMALLLFNVGVELGQLAVVAVALAATWATRAAHIAVSRKVAFAPLYGSGCLAAYWFVERTAAIVTA